MKKYLIILLLILIILISSCKNKNNSDIEFIINDTLTNVDNKKAKIVLLYGQSNATGVANHHFLKEYYPDLYSKYQDGFDNVYIDYITERGSNNSNNSFIKCKFGCGANLDYYGPEMGISNVLHNAYPDDDIFIIKYSLGGSMLDNEWLNGNGRRGLLYNLAIDFTIANLEYLIQKGYQLDILGICWMQGESDAVNIRTADRYEDNTLKLIKYFRHDLNKYYKDHLNFVDSLIAKVIFWTNYEKINAVKYNISLKDHNYLINGLDLDTTKEPIDNPDIAHYDSIDMIELGNRFGNCLIENQ